MRGYYQPASGPPFSRGGYRSMSAAAGGGGGSEAKQYTVTGALSGPFGGSTSSFRGFAFTAAEDATITAIEVYSAHEPGDLEWRLYDLDASALLRSDADDGLLTPITDTWARVTFGSGVSLTAGKRYSVGARRSSPPGWEPYSIDVPADMTFDDNTVFAGNVNNSDISVFNDADDRIFGLPRLIHDAADPGTVFGVARVPSSMSTTAGTTQTRGYEFTVGSSDITAKALRFYGAATQAGVTMKLWRVSDSALLASASLDAVADTWVEVAISDAILSANTNYVVTAYRAAGLDTYYDSGDDFDIHAAISFANGRFGTGDAFPTFTVGNIYGVVDVGFQK